MRDAVATGHVYCRKFDALFASGSCQKINEGILGVNMRTTLSLVGIALCGLMSCTAAVKTEPPPATTASAETAKYDVNVGKDYWARFSITLFGKPTVSGSDYQSVPGGTHFKIDGVVESYIPVLDQKMLDKGHYFYRIVLDDGQTQYLGTEFLDGATDVNPVVAAAECKRRGNPRVGMTAKQVEATCWGKPDHVNRKELRRGVHEQYVYGDGRFVYLHDGVVTEVQVQTAGRRRDR